MFLNLRQTRLWETTRKRRCGRHFLLLCWVESCLLLFLNLSLRSHYLPGLCGSEKYTSTKYSLFPMASPSWPQGKGFLTLPAPSPKVYMSTQAHMGSWTQSPGVPHLIHHLNCPRKSSTSNNNDDTTNMANALVGRTHSIPGSVLGTIQKSTDFTLMTGLWGRYYFSPPFTSKNSEG